MNRKTDYHLDLWTDLVYDCLLSDPNWLTASVRCGYVEVHLHRRLDVGRGCGDWIDPHPPVTVRRLEGTSCDSWRQRRVREGGRLRLLRLLLSCGPCGMCGLAWGHLHCLSLSCLWELRWQRCWCGCWEGSTPNYCQDWLNFQD